MPQTQSFYTALAAVVMAALFPGRSAIAQPTTVEHTPNSQTFNQPAGVTQREPEIPREDDAVDLYLRVSFQFTYDRVCVYYTTDGSDPSGSFGTPAGTTQVLRNHLGSITFLYNESSGGTRDWWKATLPSTTRQYLENVKYKVSAWQQFNGPEVFANSGAAYSFTNKLAWPGAGAGQPNPSAGYPPVSFWKEEALIGNTYCAAMLDQNATYYDFHFPTPGCVQGIGTRNEGYSDGPDTFPGGLPQNRRGQMHLNQAMPGIRIDGTTHWLSNPNGVSYYTSGNIQNYGRHTNSVATNRFFNNGSTVLQVKQSDYSPVGIIFPNDQGGNPQRHILVKQLIITNNSSAPVTLNVYFYLDPALNGSDNYDGMFTDPARGAMIAYDNTYRVVTGTGANFPDHDEYNPTTFAGYEKNKSVYLAAAMKALPFPSAPGGVLASDSWRDTSADSGQGWIGQKITIPLFGQAEIDFVMAGAVDNFAGASGTYNFQLAPVMDWFASTTMESLVSPTMHYWQDWLDAGVTIDTPNEIYDDFFERALLATALHFDAVNGGVVAGFHNGAYPFVWPRDAVYAARTFAATGHLDESAQVYAWMRDTTYRDFEPWGRKGFWKQKYSTDGYVVWGAPQIDETAVFPWGIHDQYLRTADTAFLAAHSDAVKDSVLSCSSDSSDSRLRFEEAFNLMYSNNVWEDSYDTFVYSNANVVRALSDAASIFTALGNAADATDATNRKNTIKSGLDARLAWDGENTDISQLGIVYPFNVYSPTDSRALHIADRINGIATDTFGNNRPLVNFSGEHQDTINRYWGDTYWNGGPWFLSTLWYGLYYAERADYTPLDLESGVDDITNHKYRIDLCKDRLGPMGLGAEQMAYGTGPGASLMYPGQQDFKLQAAWPNAWESMSTIADAIMAFLDFTPDAPSNTIHLAPKLPEPWGSMTFKGVTLVNTPAGHTHRIDAAITTPGRHMTATLTNTNGQPLNAGITLRVPPDTCLLPQLVTIDGSPAAHTYDAALGKITFPVHALNTGAGAQTVFDVWYPTADYNEDEFVDGIDSDQFNNDFESSDPEQQIRADINGDGFVDGIDYDLFNNLFDVGC